MHRPQPLAHAVHVVAFDATDTLHRRYDIDRFSVDGLVFHIHLYAAERRWYASTLAGSMTQHPPAPR